MTSPARAVVVLGSRLRPGVADVRRGSAAGLYVVPFACHSGRPVNPELPAATSNVRTGISLSLFATVCAALYFIPFKVACQAVPREQAVTLVLLSAAVFNSIAAVQTGWTGRAGRTGHGRRLKLDAVSLKTILVFGIVTVFGNYCVAQALVHVDAGVTSVLHQTQILFVVLGGWLFLQERVSARFGGAMLVVLAGIATMQLPSAGAAPLSSEGIAWGLASSFWFAVIHLWTRNVAQRVDLVQVNALRLWLAVVIMLLIPGNAAALFSVGGEVWLLCALGAFAGPFVSRLSIMFAVRHITAAQSSMITLTGPLFAFVLDFAILDVVPERWQLIGAGVVLLGVAIPILEMVRLGPRRAAVASS